MWRCQRRLTCAHGWSPIQIMKAVEAETIALRAIESARGGRAFEDHRIEYKSKMIELDRFARRLAAHANAARGSPIVWLLGFDEATGLCWPGPTQDINDWWPRVQACFEGAVAPDLVTSIARLSQEQPVTVLAFGTERAPYVVKRGTSGDEFDVPFRDGPRTRSAKRHELLAILAPAASTPNVEPLGASVSQYDETLNASFEMYIVPRGWNPLSGVPLPAIALHRCAMTVESNEGSIAFTSNVRFEAPGMPGTAFRSDTPMSANGTLLVSAPVRVRLKGAGAVGKIGSVARLRAVLGMSDASVPPVVVELSLNEMRPEQHGPSFRQAWAGGETSIPIATPMHVQQLG